MGGAMQFLVYYCATDMLQCEVINGEQKGSDISSITQYNTAARSLLCLNDKEVHVGSVTDFNPKSRLNDELFPNKDNFVFLDHSNGDYYCYKSPTIDVSLFNVETTGSTSARDFEEWVPMGNFGLHNYYFTKENKYCSRVKKVKAYKPTKHHIESQDLAVITSKLTDVKCELISKHLSHYLLKDLPFEFLVNSGNSWDPHAVKPTSVTGANGKYLELAESDRGPQIVAHGHAIAVQFYIHGRQQPETQTLINNFVLYFVNKIYNNEKVDMSVEEARVKNYNPGKISSLSLALKKICHERRNNMIVSLDTNDRVPSGKCLNPSDSNKSMQNSILMKCNSISRTSIKGRPISSKQLSSMSSKAFHMNNVYNNGGTGIDMASKIGSRHLLKSRETRLNMVNYNYRSMQAGNSNDIDSVKSNKIINSYCDILVQAKQKSVRNKLKSAGVTQDENRNRSVGLRFHNRSSDHPPTHNHIKDKRNSIPNKKLIGIDVHGTKTALAKYDQNIIYERKYSENQVVTPSVHKSISHKVTPHLTLNNTNTRDSADTTLIYDHNHQSILRNPQKVKETVTPNPMEKKTRFKNSKKIKKKVREFESCKEKVKINSDIYSRFYNRWKEFKRLPQYDLDKPSVAISGPYLAEKEQKWKIEKEKWVSDSDFRTIFGKKASRETSNYIPNYVTKAPSNPPILHKFREEERAKWIDKSGFFA